MNYGNMKRSETTEQINLFTWAQRNEAFVPELALMFHVPNEGKRKQTTGQILKAAGLKSGVPDVCLPVARKGFNGLYIEMKYGKNKPTEAQREFMQQLEAEGNKTAVAYSFEEAREIIRQYLSRGEDFNLVNCEEAVKIFDYCEGVDVDFAPCKQCQFFKDNRKEK